MDHQRRAQLARVDDALHLRIAAVIAAHEADLYQTLAVRELRFDDLFAVRSVLCERLFAEYVFAVCDAFQHIARMARVGRGDDDRLHLGGGDQFFAGFAGLETLILGGGFGGRLLKIVGAGHDLTARHQIVQAADMVAADRAAADDTNVQHSYLSLLLWIRQEGPVLSCLSIVSQIGPARKGAVQKYEKAPA